MLKSMKMVLAAFACLGALVASAVSDAEAHHSSEMNAAGQIDAALGTKGGAHVVILGNSIMLHGCAPSIGWTNNWGMAASSASHDYAHLVVKGVEYKTGKKAEAKIANISPLERNLETYDYSKLDEYVNFKPQYLVIAIGENVPNLAEADRPKFAAAMDKLLASFTGLNPKPVCVVRGVFWPNAWKDEILKKAAEKAGVTFVKADFGSDPEMTAKGLFWHSGVQGHPGDKGMLKLAKTILAALFPNEKAE